MISCQVIYDFMRFVFSKRYETKNKSDFCHPVFHAINRESPEELDRKKKTRIKSRSLCSSAHRFLPGAELHRRYTCRTFALGLARRVDKIKFVESPIGYGTQIHLNDARLLILFRH